MKTILGVLLFVSSVSWGQSTTPVPQMLGLQPVYVTDANGNGLLDQVNANALSVSLGSTTGKAVIGKGGTLAAASTAYNEPLAYTTSAGKNLYITGYEIEASLSTVSATTVGLGYCSLQIPRGTTVATYRFVNASHGGMDRISISPAEPIAVQSLNTVVVSCLPSAATSVIWGGNIVGYQK